MRLARNLARNRLFLTLVIVLSGMLLSMWAASRVALQTSLHDESESVQRQLTLYAQAMVQRVDRYRTLPEVLALDAELKSALSHPLSAAEVDRLNHKLEQANGASQASTLTLIDKTGKALAASNWRDSHSNVGEDYSFRPYVTQALSRGSGRFYGIGMTTGLPGYFLSQAIHDEDGSVLGLIAIKILFQELEGEWSQSPDIVFASDEHGVVFLSNRDEWRYRLLEPLSASDEREVRDTHQYAGQALMPLGYRTSRQPAGIGMLAHFSQPPLVDPMLWLRMELPESQWQLHLLHDIVHSQTTSHWAAVAAGGLWLAASLLVLYIRQRQRLAALRQRSRKELETVLHQHAQELRTAQDGIVQAAKQADTGLSRSLQHLPQGVVVVDPQLRLVAWNSRYVELFRYPPELMHVGQPIEALIRHNARRGLLGKGNVEQAIQRRLEHLRSGSPHLHESAKGDGTVLEIRGNPLPDGGFVTSYADITSYKNTARELRNLADTLEKRIADRTRDLAKAKQEAERANRYKTRFVASAVHDLLQPLNAARIFTSLLPTYLHDDAGRQLAQRVDKALASQDAILTSLLDISRMESGQLEVRVRDFALSSLLEVVHNNFALQAENEGLSLHCMPSRLIVRSDEALLRRILQNFVSNAIRYTRKGRIVVGCRRQGDQVLIEVHDQGPGIPQSLQKEIFEEFRRLDEGHADDRGTGLGLAIVERLGRLLDHEIGLRSTLGKGSVFWVKVPLGQAAALTPVSQEPSPSARVDSPLQGGTVWYVEDDPATRDATCALLERWGCDVPLAANAPEALTYAAPGNAPQLVLLDVHLGQLYGPDVYAQLCERWGRQPPVILLTAEGDSTLRRQAAERGWGFLAKPVRPPALRALMSQTFLRGRDGGSA
ncbi:response regulator [Comamonas sp. Tr-654]|uniref:hybrid sensor histidine kinase/response regulator n=1 Tax=Comamonas sp. Tr-654 TaxID=2608341 RepID=UPI001423E3CC|nr:PAS-domain containing protein [Comamonas sp. Tr-654]NIF83047.1 response regulator [Comamonas sp. Tr-654]